LVSVRHHQGGANGLATAIGIPLFSREEADMNDADREPFDRLMQAERVWVLAHPQPPLPPAEPRTVHYTELPESASGPLAAEWNVYRREVGRLLAEGHEGRWVLIKGEEIIGVWDTEGEADRVRLDRFLMQDVLLKQILTREPALRGGGHHRRWRS
jgi:hypothetical protein